VLCFGYKLLGGKTQVPSLADFPRPSKKEEPDARLLKFVHKVLTEDADIIVSWYGKEYDRKFLNSRMLMVGLPPLPPLNSEHVDLYFTARGNLKLHANRLQSVSEALGCPYSKTPVRADIWRMAMREDPQAMRYIIDHCKRDVDILVWCYMKLRPFVRQHPYVADRRCSSRAAESATSCAEHRADHARRMRRWRLVAA